TNWEGGTVSVFLGKGSGVLAWFGDFKMGPNPWSLISADLDGDKRPDLVAVNQDGNTATVLFNQGGAVFGGQLTLIAGKWANGVAAADLDGDGKLDLAVANKME